MNNNPSYIKLFTYVPSSIYQTKELTCEEKLIAERLIALCQNKGHAWVSNKYLADMYGIREDTVSKHIKKLEKYGFIRCSYEKKNSKEKKIRRRVYITEDLWGKYHNRNSTNNQKENGQTAEDNNKDNNKKEYKENTTQGIRPIWLKHPEMCESEPCTPEEQREMEELLKEFK